MAEPGVFETIYNCRAIRYFTSDPVPDELVTKLLDAAIRAPSGSNRQAWHFVVVTDPAIKKTLQEYYKQSFDVYASMMANVAPRPGVSEETHPSSKRALIETRQPKRHAHASQDVTRRGS